MQKIYLTKIILNNYRNFEHFAKNFDNDIILITGNNGSGKTNILEAISYLSPGRGIRGAKQEDLCRDDKHSWQFDIQLQSKLGIANISSKYDIHSRKRNIEYNGSKTSSNELHGLANVVWLTPQMNGIFVSSRSNRLRFFDRIVFSFFSRHAANINKLEHFHKERLNHLTNNIGNFDNAWLTILEKQIVGFAEQIQRARDTTISRMQNSINNLETEFPVALLSLTDIFDICDEVDYNQEHDNAKFTDEYSQKLKQSREKDGYSGRTNFGVHRVDFCVIHKGNNKDASICSTGEQKAMLISIFLAQVEAIIAENYATPILLMDELFVHLDDLRKKYLSQYAINRGVQVFVTATDTYGIENIAAHAQRITL